MKISLIILVLGFALVASVPNPSNRQETTTGATFTIPCGGTENIESCQCNDGTTTTTGAAGCNGQGLVIPPDCICQQITSTESSR